MSELDTKEFYDNQMDAEGIVLSKDQIPPPLCPKCGKVANDVLGYCSNAFHIPAARSSSTPPSRDWLEDADHENGQYTNRCVWCKQTFVGHKRRVTCKLCVATPSSPERPAPDEIVFPSREMTPEDLAALRVRPEEPSAFVALLDELLEVRQRIASGECRSWDEADYFAEVANDLRFRVEGLYNKQREEITHLQFEAAKLRVKPLTDEARAAAAKDRMP